VKSADDPQGFELEDTLVRSSWYRAPTWLLDVETLARRSCRRSASTCIRACQCNEGLDRLIVASLHKDLLPTWRVTVGFDLRAT